LDSYQSRGKGYPFCDISLTHHHRKSGRVNRENPAATDFHLALGVPPRGIWSQGQHFADVEDADAGLGYFHSISKRGTLAAGPPDENCSRVAKYTTLNCKTPYSTPNK